MAVKKHILVVDDNEVNRTILNKILSKEFIVLEAENGRAGLDMLVQNKGVIAAVILDLVMPVMDGYGFLKEYSKNAGLTNIPVIVSTENSDRKNEKKALSFGAWDFISKPYDVDIINFRLHNCIKRTELALFEKMKYMAEFDELTGLYNRTKFYEQTRLLIDSNPDTEFVMVRFDINKFSLLNNFYGKVAGDRLLKYIAEYLRCFAQTMEFCTYGRINSDVFAFCCNFLGKEVAADIWKKYNDELKGFSNEYNIVASWGMYVIDDTSLTVEKMYDRAALAAKSIKGNYLENVCYFKPEMLGSIETEQLIINEMEDALKTNQFTVYFQPKYDIRTNKPAGAEGLVRWIHPTKGIVSPGVFIPAFERNGFIMKLDFYVWESTCKYLRKWLDEGITPLPVSINVSRVNLYSTNLSKKICDLVDKYKVPHGLFQIEITESIYSSDNNFLDNTLRELEKMGFTILMDDFGSGYSSLNVLKDVSVDVLKIDMKFMQTAKKEGRAETILACVMRMAKWLNLPVIAEGVETAEQVEFLRGLGCEFVQGYYFARPMPAADYEKLIREVKPFDVIHDEPFEEDNLWEAVEALEKAVTFFNKSFVVFEVDNKNTVNVISVNKVFYNIFGKGDTLANAKGISLVDTEDKNFAQVSGAFRKIIDDKQEIVMPYKRTLFDGNSVDAVLTLKHFRDIGNTSIILGNIQPA